MSNGSGQSGRKVICTNRKARHEYSIEDTYEAGMVLMGSEVKSLRAGKVQLNDAWVKIDEGGAWLMQAHIAPYPWANLYNHEPLRPRKLLLHKKELKKLRDVTRQKGYTLVPLELYFKRGFAKLQFGLGKGKKLYDKRADLKASEAKREMARAKKYQDR